ncbi:2-oxo acid dehydrogenase subunit E2 [Lentzea sp. DG1S-22]|uniref:2-oxo acid dehydrogenase subunit E2 n=1 Tax=Lentzea sp. DG1S-22 TaxID=3108822 RepID=UPI002E7714DF|nr:2-oxo acid dehydrogenase subunit E2 [Lentzea sp. DG1S-22]WVH82075.1 2-oxo acid dehydrogenase subunit E2 [Lentzea sp. DG1S-22]
MTTPEPRVVEALNRALHRLFAERPGLHLLGEDVLDPYGGAFKVTKGLSTAHPDRVLSTPLSEAGIAGVAAGLALAGGEVVLEVMFGDFAALMFDQVLNLISKSVTMYGHVVPMPVVLRCPVGGGRGYGPTHSQSVQKHFLGIPNLALYETTPFHDPHVLLTHALDEGPAVLFEDKVLYTRRMFTGDDLFRVTTTGPSPGWAHVTGPGPADVVLLCPGGVAHRALAAARTLLDQGVHLHLLVPGRLHPLDLDDVLPLLRQPRLVAVAEESTAGGTWGAEVAAQLHERLWHDLSAPVLRLSSKDSIIPSSRHLEDQVLLGEHDIVSGVLGALRSPVRTHVAEKPAAASTGVARPAATITAPKLNNNDETYLVLAWLVQDGDEVEPSTPLVELETSKAVEVVEAGVTGRVRLLVQENTEIGVGAVLAEVVDADAPEPPATTANPTVVAAEPATAPADARTHVLSRAQRGTAAVVTRAHREVPAAFTAVEVVVDVLTDRLRRYSDDSGAQVGLPEAVVKAVAGAHPDFAHLFGTLTGDHVVSLPDAPHVAVTMDVGNGLYTPVVRDCGQRSIADIADDLMDLRMKAYRGEFTAGELTGGTITVSLNLDEGVLLVQPIVMWPQVCMVSVSGPRASIAIEDGVPVRRSVVTLGLAYDHRVVNGRDAAAFLRAVAESLSDPQRLDKLVE